MSRSWANRYTDLSPDATNILTALTVLDVTDVRPADLAVALDTGADEIEAAVDKLREAGWVANRPASGGDVLVDGARIWLHFDAPAQPAPDEAKVIASRVLTTVNAALDPTRHNQDDIVQWITDHKESVLTAVRAGVRVEQHSLAASVAAAAWQVAGQVPDHEWRRELARSGEEAARMAREPDALIDLLNRSAVLFEDAGDLPAAEVQRVRVAQLAFELGEHDRIVAALSAQIELYGRWGRRGPAVDALLELADAQREAGNAVGRAEALAHLGFLMLSAGRAAKADTYFETADELFSRAAPGLVPPTMRALVLELWGRALWPLGHSIRARRCWAKALDVLGDHDPVASARIRGLLDTHADAPTLPDDMPQPAPLRATGSGERASQEL